jgi:hypothetical protein
MSDILYVVMVVLYGLCAIGLVEVLYCLCGGLAKIFISCHKDKQYRRLRKEFLDYPVEMVDGNGKIFYPRYRKS